MKREGIAFAGNIITDNVKIVGSYPEKGMLVTIESESLAVGGCAPNTAIDVKKLDPSLKVKVLGRVGKDDKGKYAVKVMKDVGIDVSGVLESLSQPTSYSDVITVKETGERTFFHHRGANSEFCLDDIDVKSLDCKILHAGYLMLLDSFDKLDNEGRTQMSRLLENAQREGIKTSIDLVSESSGNFLKETKSSLPFCDYVIINEVEAGNIAGIEPRDGDGDLIYENVEKIMQTIMSYGVKEKVIVHCPECGFCLDKSGEITKVKSYKLPKGFIKGTVGAGDAFCAGTLLSIYNNLSDSETLRIANLTAVNCLSKENSIDGIVHKDKLEEVLKSL